MRRPDLMAIATLAGMLLAVAARGGYAPGPVFDREYALIARSDYAGAMALMDSVIEASGTRHADQLEAKGRKGWLLAHEGRLDDATAVLLDAGRRAAAERDTVHWVTSLRVLAGADLDAGRIRAAVPLVHRLLSLARAEREPKYVAAAEMLSGYAELLQGHFARSTDLYRAALAGFEHMNLAPIFIEQAHVGLARASSAEGRLDEARHEYAFILAQHQGAGWNPSAADALNNLGVIEMDDGDPAAAIVDWQRALAQYERAGDVQAVLATRVNLARALSGMGRLEESASALRATADSARTHAAAAMTWKATEALAEVLEAQGMHQQALETAREVVAGGGDVPESDRQFAVATSTAALVGLGRTQEALEGVDRLRKLLAGPLDANNHLTLVVSTAKLDLRLGRPLDVLALLRNSALIDSKLAWEIHYYRASAWAALGKRSRSLAELARASAGWEEWRGVSSDLRWHEARGELSRQVYGLFGRLLLDPAPGPQRDAGLREGFDVLQMFKARTLGERISGSNRPPARGAPGSTLAWLRAGGLHPGEVYLDFYAGVDSVFAFAIAPGSFRAVSLNASSALLGRVSRVRDVLAAPPGDADSRAACDAAMDALGQSLLGGLADLVRGAHRIIVCPDGPLAQVPFGALRLGGRPLIQDHEVVVVPSADVLRRVRTASAPRATRGLLALEGSRARDGARLPGSVREVDWLEHEFRDVAVCNVTSRDLLDRLQRCDVVHVAAHVEANPIAPWRTAILLRDTPSPVVSDDLRADAVARLRMGARLAVLASCQTFVSRTSAGEGVVGLSTAFLSAGVPTVLATLWPVDDDHTAAFVEDFYTRLEAGVSAASALQGAQRDAIARADTGHPHFWAGFVLVGEPGTRLRLRSRS